MLLSEALAERKSALKSISELTESLKAAAIRYEDAEPSENVDAVEGRLTAAQALFRDLTVKINLANNDTAIAFDGAKMTLMEAIALRESLLLAVRSYRTVRDHVEEAMTGRRYERRTKDQVRQIAVLPASALRARHDAAAARLRALDMEIQKANWTTNID